MQISIESLTGLAGSYELFEFAGSEMRKRVLCNFIEGHKKYEYSFIKSSCKKISSYTMLLTSSPQFNLMR